MICTSKHFAVVALLFACTLAHAAFEENSRRYLSGNDLIQSIQGVIGQMGDFNCNSIQPTNAPFLGVNSPTSGQPISATPTQSLVMWVSKCVRGHAALNAFAFQSSVIGEDFKTKHTEAQIQLYSLRPWSQLPAEVKSSLVSSMVKRILGPDELIADFGFSTGEQIRGEIIKQLDAEGEALVSEVILRLTTNLILRDEFLSY